MIKDYYISLTDDALRYARSVLFSHPRELSGATIFAIEKTLDCFEGSSSDTFIDQWYRSADIAQYETLEASAAYLGAYGPRSILKYQEAFFSQLINKHAIPKSFEIVDFGAGPCVGYCAFLDVLETLSNIQNITCDIHYTAVDRSASMLEVGEYLCKQYQERSSINATFQKLSSEDFRYKNADLLVVANVMNDGEGITNCSEFLLSILQLIESVHDIIIIEPATEQPSRQMCSLSKDLHSCSHIGPCIPKDTECDQWSFRQFNKRIYSFEYRCLGKWASAARQCKYSLSQYSTDYQPRSLLPGERIVVSNPTSSGWAMTCKDGEKQRMRVASSAKPWDIVDETGKISRWWP